MPWHAYSDTKLFYTWGKGEGGFSNKVLLKRNNL
jgi:hypothetical protein